MCYTVAVGWSVVSLCMCYTAGRLLALTVGLAVVRTVSQLQYLYPAICRGRLRGNWTFALLLLLLLLLLVVVFVVVGGGGGACCCCSCLIRTAVISVASFKYVFIYQ